MTDEGIECFVGESGQRTGMQGSSGCAGLQRVSHVPSMKRIFQVTGQGFYVLVAHAVTEMDAIADVSNIGLF